ncbi:filamentous hemagglutinin family protein [Herbaspirillum rubrisubalbicans]|uniref:beta strand repeat-containing protein n=1 Tax=Herbaspirillum rubrisubalbicans TaxID=80842 RepID=UPI00209FED43|nr:filamentous hemagglutinin N-terminal domain-containing protein [Herbaspirillum rubrisubalbicans]MCP1575652.1 filamentous hemagglutinin family protein [Herbaspirillum rubrisubalbicans]
MTSTSTPVQTPAQPAIALLPPSITVRVGKRKLTLSWRARKPLPVLLSRLLRRSWLRVLAPCLRISVAAAAVCGAWQAPVLAAAPAPGTLPTGWSVVNGNVSFSQSGNTLNINQLSPQAIARFASFSIGSDAAVNVAQPSSSAALLAKVSGGDISQIYGKLSANGTVVLYNPNGVVIGPSGTVDAGRFIATSLAISDSDFLAGKLNFAKDGSAGLVDNQGKINSATGGSVYLIGGSVSNSGIINSPQGEVILAAGQTVTLADTATPGVTVNVTGSAGNVTNLGTITAEAGRIGVAAGLITNSGVINASSVVREGGRIFLRAAGNLTTTANSSISADGTKGGNVTLYAQNKAFIDGDVSATGAPGKGGFVETSGLQQLAVVKVPKVGSGGTWLIDPYDLEVVPSNLSNVTGTLDSCTSTYAVSVTGNSSTIAASTLSAQLSDGVNVTLNTTGNGTQAGNILISAAINKTGETSSTLTLNAANNITINADIASDSQGTLGLDLNMGLGNAGVSHVATIGNGASIRLNGGAMNVRNGFVGGDSGGSANGTLSISNGNVNLAYMGGGEGPSGSLYAGQVNIGGNGSLTTGGGSEVSISGLNNNGTVTFGSGYNNLTIGAAGISNNGTLNITGRGQLTSAGDVVNNANGSILVSGGSNFTLAGQGQWTNNGTLNISGSNTQLSMNDNVSLTNNGQMNIGAGAALYGNITDSNSHDFTNNGTLTLLNGNLTATNITNNANATISGNGTLNTSSSGSIDNYGTLSPGGSGTVGALTIGGGKFEQHDSGKMLIDIGSNVSGGYDQITFVGNTSVTLNGTLQTHLLNNYTSSSVLQPFGNKAVGGYFRYVTGDVITVGGAEQMVKASYGDGILGLSLRGAETFTASAAGDWGSNSSWNSTGNSYLPTQIDNVVFGQNANLSHQSGNDVVASLQVNGNGTLNLSGGNLTVRNTATINGTANVSGGTFIVNGNTSGNGTITIGGTNDGPVNTQSVRSAVRTLVASDSLITEGNVTLNNTAQSTLTVQLNHGNLTLGGNVHLGSLTVSDGTVTGNTGSRLVADYFSQQGGNLSLADASFSLTCGTLAVGNITANNLELNASGELAQNDGTSLHVKSQLIAAASTGISLSNSGNQIAGFAANNSGTGDITLKNTLNTTDASAVSINGVSTATGNVSIDNTGGVVTSAIGSKADFLGSLPLNSDGSTVSASSRLATLGINSTGQLKSANGSVSVVTHSPLTIGAGGVSATGTITLTASASSGNNDTLIVNGVLVSTGGNINLTAGDTMTINANISTSPPGVALFSVQSGQVVGYAQGVTIRDAHGTRTPVTASTTNANSSSTSSSGVSNSNSSSTVVFAPSQTTQIVQQQQNQQSQNLQTTVSKVQLSDTTAYQATTVIQQNNSSGQTTGGTSGNFGDEGGERKQNKKPLPMCT